MVAPRCREMRCDEEEGGGYGLIWIKTCTVERIGGREERLSSRCQRGQAPSLTSGYTNTQIHKTRIRWQRRCS